MKRFALAAALVIGLISPAWADFAAGVEAYDGGDYATALSEWRPLAEQGDAEAQIALANMYLFGVGVRQDYREAAKWYRRAAEQGEVIAQINLGELYATGRGVAKDDVLAYMWFSLAAADGHPYAEVARDELAPRMTPDQVARAEELARAWTPKAP
ncbi:MAG: tetratricopeptide repeat protein [Alphaproteobacteria bacterium]